jgi:hypothetical protein
MTVYPPVSATSRLNSAENFFDMVPSFQRERFPE